MTVFIQYDEPKKVPRRRIIPNMSVLGKQYRTKAKAIFTALETATPAPSGADVEVDGEMIHIPADLFEVRDEIVDIRGEDIVPHVIEPSYGIDRMCYAVLEQAYDEDTADGETRVVMRLLPQVAPVQVAVFPLMTRDDLDTIAGEITRTLHKTGILAEYDDSGAIGRRYRRQDEIGTPFAITVDYETKENNSVTLRDRDTMKQVRIPITKLPRDSQGPCGGEHGVHLPCTLMKSYELASVIPSSSLIPSSLGIYQLSIAMRALDANTMVILPTGLGKTAVALLVAASRLYNEGGRVLMLAPTKPLVEQHLRFFERYLLAKSPMGSDVSPFVMFTGEAPPAERTEDWNRATVILATPQVVKNDLIAGRYTLKDVTLLIVDECHRAVGNYAYVFLAQRYLAAADKPRILAMTASPGGSAGESAGGLYKSGYRPY